MSILNKLTEGIVSRDLRQEGDALLQKWEKTGLLEGIQNNNAKSAMSRLLENQAKELLREASSMAAGDVEGFAAVAFPIVRRVFGGLIANDLVSVQPMSLPSGLIFFMDFTYEDGRHGPGQNQSVYGGGVVGSGLLSGATDILETGGGFYNLANAYSSPTGSVTVTFDQGPINSDTAISSLTEAQKKFIQWDPDLLDAAGNIVQRAFPAPSQLNRKLVTAISGTLLGEGGAYTGGQMVRRLTTLTGSAGGANDFVVVTFHNPTGSVAGVALNSAMDMTYPTEDNFTAGGALGSVVGTDNWGLEEPEPSTGNVGSTTGKATIAEIDIKVDSVAVTAITKKLKAKWTPELGQDLNAYHNLDAEVELTSILSEHIALEIDREILNDLIKGSKAGTYYWSRSPGLFVNRTTGAELGASSAAPDFTGTVSEWYETLVETINDVSAQIHRKTLRGGATFLVTSPEVANILEFTSGFRANITHDDDRGTVGAVKSGNLSKKWDVYVDPYFPRNLVLVGRKGGSFLESGYVYAPYVPLQVTPTIFGTEDFVPRKGVMTRYAKKMVRPDMYGLVVVRGLLGEEGAS